MSDALSVLSAGAIEPGLVAAAGSYREEHGMEVVMTWATTPVIRRRLSEGWPADVVVATAAAVADFARDRKLDPASAVRFGDVGIGVVVRDELQAPDISTVGALRYALLDADSIVLTRATSGIYVEKMLAELNVLERISKKLARYGNGPAMMEHLLQGRKRQGREIGIGAIPEILMFRGKGLKLAGPLPDGLQHFTSYLAAPLAGAVRPDGALAFVRFLASPAGRENFAAHGIA